jgi:hypothetical protein
MRRALALLVVTLGLSSVQCAPPRVEAKDALTLRVNLAALASADRGTWETITAGGR